MAEKRKLFFVVLCTFNPNIKFFKMQIDSLCRQSYPYWKCIVVDDFSIDKTFKEMCDILQCDDRFSVERNETRLGIFHNFEKGLTLVPNESDLICYCDQDDVWMPNKLASMLEPFEMPDVMLCHSDLQLIDEENAILSQSCFQYERRNTQDYSLKQLVVRNAITGCAVVFRSSLLPHLLPFHRQESKKPFYHHDQWTALHAAMHGRIETIQQPLISYRQHGKNTVGLSSVYSHAFAWRHFSLKMFSGKIKILERIVSLWKSRQALMNDFLDTISSQNLTPKQQHEVHTLKKWANLRSLSPSWFFFSIQQFLKRDPSYLVCFLSILGKWVVICQKKKP